MVSLLVQYPIRSEMDCGASHVSGLILSSDCSWLRKRLTSNTNPKTENYSETDLETTYPCQNIEKYWKMLWFVDATRE